MTEVPQVNRWVVSMAVVSATFMEVLDTTVVNVALPHVAGSMSSTVEEGTWTLTSYLVANAIILPMTGWLAQQFGRKRLLLMAISLFTFTSFLCGLAPNLACLIFFRIIQGASGGVMQPMSQSIMLESFPPHERGKAMAAWAVCIVTAPILGPVIGGWLTDSYSWRWIFYINIPVGIFSLIMVQMFVFDPSYLKRKSQKIDYWGIGMLAVGMGSLQIFLDKGQQEDWFSSTFITILAILFIVLLLSFLLRELLAEHPIIDLRVFKDRSYAIGVFIITAVGFVLYGSMVLLPIVLQTLLGYPALQAGKAMAPRGIGSLLFMPVVGILISRIEARKLLSCGVILCAVTLFWFGFLNLNLGFWDLFWPQILQGVSMSLLFVPMTTMTMNFISKEEMGNATSIFNLMRNIGGSIGIATAATMLERNRQTYTNILGTHITPYAYQSQQMLSQLKSALMAKGIDPISAGQRANAMLFGSVQRHATMLSFIELMRLFGILFILLLPLIWLAKSSHTKNTKAQPEKNAHP
jgi:MFS transporter, DHA2 family, multidrug resistance protein